MRLIKVFVATAMMTAVNGAAVNVAAAIGMLFPRQNGQPCPDVSASIPHPVVEVPFPS